MCVCVCVVQGAQSNGVFEICAKEPLLSPWEVNGGSKDVHIMENPQVLLYLKNICYRQ